MCLINRHGPIENRGPSWPWSYASWIYNYLSNQCLSPLMLWVRILIKARCTTLCYKVCQWLTTDRWFSPGPLVSSTNKTDRHDIAEILLKVALSTIKQANIKLAYFYKYKFWMKISLINFQICRFCDSNIWSPMLLSIYGFCRQNRKIFRKEAILAESSHILYVSR